ncbi:MAG TPA: antibiotic biosynthesis monooxygenase [Novosphingobium sp.]|nr:antibiotic biosynthesis monooxygenase [Novosphingobium sp.]
MAIVQTYRLAARADSAAALAAALAELAAALAAAPGTQGTRILRRADAPAHFLFLEFWDSEEARKAAAPLLPKAAMAALMAALEGKPEVATYADA